MWFAANINTGRGRDVGGLDIWGDLAAGFWVALFFDSGLKKRPLTCDFQLVTQTSFSHRPQP